MGGASWPEAVARFRKRRVDSGVSTCSIACWTSRSTTVGMPNCCSLPRASGSSPHAPAADDTSHQANSTPAVCSLLTQVILGGVDGHPVNPRFPPVRLHSLVSFSQVATGTPPPSIIPLQSGFWMLGSPRAVRPFEGRREVHPRLPVPRPRAVGFLPFSAHESRILLAAPNLRAFGHRSGLAYLLVRLSAGCLRACRLRGLLRPLLTSAPRSGRLAAPSVRIVEHGTDSH